MLRFRGKHGINEAPPLAPPRGVSGRGRGRSPAGRAGPVAAAAIAAMAWGASLAECLREWEELQDGYQRIQVPPEPGHPRARPAGALRPSGERRGYRHRRWEMPRGCPAPSPAGTAGSRALASGVRVLSSRVPALGSEPCALGQSVSEQGRGARAVPGRGAREERGTPGLMPTVDVAWRAQISRFSCWERGAAVPGVARPDEVRRCRFTPYGSSQLSSGQPGAGQPRRDSGQQSRGVPESRHASARHLVPSAVPCHRRGWPGAPCQEGDSVSEVLPPALCNPQGAACRGRSGQGSAHTGSPKGKVGQPSPAAARVTRLQLHRSLSPSFPPGSGVKRMLLRTRRRCAQIWGKGGFEKPPLAP